MYHSFFIHSSVDEHLGCFHVIDVVNSAAMNIGVHESFSGLIPGSGKSLGEGHGNVLQCSCLENPLDRERNLKDYSPQGNKQTDLTERLTLSHLHN